MIPLYLKRLVLSILILATVVTAGAQSPPSYTSADIYMQLQKLNVLGSVLYIGAHPDDENTRLLAWLSKEKKYRTAYLSLTRGDGGQNLIGDEQGVALGLIRTQELLAARRVDGAEQYFSTAYDFGFSKNSDETFNIWDREKILADVVWVIRKFRPDVIITRFPGDERAGHGHHAASAILAREAFFAAADTTRFFSQFNFGVGTWQAKRLLWNTYNFGNNNTTDVKQFKVDVGGYNPLLGKSYGEIAAESRSQHKSQGFGVPSTRGTSYEYLETIEGEPPVNDLMDGVDITWKRTGDNYPEQRVNDLLKQFNPAHPDQCIPGLLEIKAHFDTSMNASPWTSKKTEEIDALIQASMGLYFEATAREQFAVTGDSIQVTFTVIKRSPVDVKKVFIIYADTMFTLADSLEFNIPKTVRIKRKVKASLMQDQPYWLREQMTTGGFKVSAQSLIGLPQNTRYDVNVSFIFDDNKYFSSIYPLQYKHTDPVKGEIYQPVIIVPPVVVNTLPSVVLTNVVPRISPHIMVRYQSLTDQPPQEGNIVFTNDDLLATKKYRFNLEKNKQQDIVYGLDTLLKINKNIELNAGIMLNDPDMGSQTFGNYMRLINYDHIPTVHYFYKAKVKVITDEIRTVGKRIGYIKGAGDYVPDALEAMGFTVVMLNEEDLVPARLAGLDAVLTGVRAYNVQDFLGDKYDVLMDYVKKGGNLVVQYNTSGFNSGVSDKMGPYPFTISRGRVTDETANVNFLLPGHPVLNYPNKISSKDFEGWVQERGLYFAERPDPHYQMPLSMADPGEEARSGGLIISDYGKGKFVYTGLAFFRELPAGVPGAYRLLANIIALNGKKGF